MKQKCPHQINSINCLGCINDSALTKRIDHKINQQKFQFFFQELALASEFCLHDDLDVNTPYKDFVNRITTAFHESQHILDDIVINSDR